MNADSNKNGYSRRKFMETMGGVVLSAGLLSAVPFNVNAESVKKQSGIITSPAGAPQVDRVAADPRDIPAPIKRSTPKTHKITLESKEMVAEIEDGVQFKFMTYGGQVPGPMIRVRQGDTIILTHKG